MKTRHHIVVASILIALFVSAPGFAEQQTYTVKKGDNLYRIGKLFNTTPDALKALNGLENEKLSIGQILKVSTEQPAASAQTVKTPAIQPQTETAANNTGNPEQPQTQQVQQAHKETQTYTVRKGDTISEIAQSFKLSVKEINDANNLINSKIQTGQVLTIPVRNNASNKTQAVKTAVEESAAVKTPPAPATSVQAVETSAIQSQAETAANTGNPEQPQAKQVQQTRKETQTYTVRKGDTVSGIAQSFKLSVKDINDANNLRNNKIQIGQVLTIPVKNNTSDKTQVAKAAEAESAPVRTQFTPVAAKTATLPTANLTNFKPTMDGELTTRDRLVEAGVNMLGVRYRFGGTSEKTGLDCSALVKNLFAKVGFTLPRSSREQYKQGEKVAKEDLQKGDLVFFSSSGKTPTHVGIYIGDNQFLHAARSAKKVIISDMGKTWYDLRYLGARRIMELWWEDTEIPLTPIPLAQMPLDDASREKEPPLSVQKDDASPEEVAAASIAPKEDQ